MSGAAFTTLTARVVPLLVSDIDTDQIIPARFLKTTSREGLGKHLFNDWRAAGDFVLDRPESQGAKILLAGDNFGCGSSREHAPWALVDWGFRAVVATRFADIFKNNATKNGLLPVIVPAETHAALALLRAADADMHITIDLASCVLSAHGLPPVTFPVDPFVRRCLLAGDDELTYLRRFTAAVEAHERAHGV
jgi:3-isopropylmalate/(R)-2-methylmalate dehydratase small subunit